MNKKHLSEFNTRQYMLDENFELFYYEDTHLKNVAAHTHSYYEFYFFVSGNISMCIDKKTYKLKNNDVILIPPGTSHSLKAHDSSVPYRRFVFWIDADYFEIIRAQSNDFNYIIEHTTKNKQYIYSNDVISFSSIQTKLFSLIEEIHSNRFGQNTKIFLCICDLIFYLNRMAYEQTNSDQSQCKKPRLTNLVAYIEDHLAEPLSLDSIADAFFVSKYHIAHVFKEHYGISIHQFITKKRLAICRNALLLDENITDVFTAYGFKEYSNFYRAFKKEYGLSPKEYKELHEIKRLQDTNSEP